MTTRDYLNEDGTPMRCNDCDRPTYYDYDDEDYHHASRPFIGCFLIASDDRDEDLAHPLLEILDAS